MWGIVLLEVLAVSFAGNEAFKIYTEGNLNCQNSEVQCITNTSYTTCATVESFTILLNTRITCPDGYICNDSTSTPCVLPNSQKNETDDNSVTSTTNTISTISTTSTNSAISTTTPEPVTRPSGPPNCKADGLWPAPECNQFYECIKKTGFFAWGYRTELRTCSEGNNFDSASLTCVPASQSDCS
ncbi:uncharacterized protein [Leptinotarsa decemlineata]|uniref:uncharacterized protein n=1 Tax=Leptinotarsa decemlineata TaxID=7539 RepID=UPI003D306B77